MSNPIIVHDQPAPDYMENMKTQMRILVIHLEQAINNCPPSPGEGVPFLQYHFKNVADACAKFLPEPQPAEKKTGNAVGITYNAKHLLAWSYANDNDIRVVGDVCAPGQMQISGYDNKKLVLVGSVFGSRWLAIRLARFIRNGLVSHRMKRRRNKKNRAARKPVNPVENKEAV